VYLVAIAWLYVALMMAVAEATHSNGTVLGAIVTFLLYGLLPTALVLYVMGTPLRRKARLAREAAEWQAMQAQLPPGPSISPDASGHAPGAPEVDGIASVRKPQ